MGSNKLTPINVVTGYLGAGKTTIIRNLLNQIPHPEKVVWLKNEYGDVNVDALMLQQTHVQVTEIINGCLCCVLVGRLGEAIKEILATNPDRIIIETSGTAYPLPIVLELSRIPKVIIDSVITVLDVLNFKGYADTSVVGQMQYQAVDLVIFNKWELADEALTEAAKDSVLGLKPNAQIILSQKGTVSADLCFGIGNNHNYSDTHQNIHLHHPDEVQVFELKLNKALNIQELNNIFLPLINKDVIRIKGPILAQDGICYFYNWILGRGTWEPILPANESKLVFMYRQGNSEVPKLVTEMLGKYI